MLLSSESVIIEFCIKPNIVNMVVKVKKVFTFYFVFFVRLHMVRLMLLERLLQHLSQLHNVGGVQAIPYMQVILMLTSDLDGEDEKDKGALDDLLAQLIAELGMHKKVTTVSLCLIKLKSVSTLPV